MLNMMKAEIYRLVRGKTIYITAAILVALVVLMVCTDGSVGVSISSDAFPAGAEMAESGGIAAVRKCLGYTDNLIYFMIPLFMSVSMTMFTCGTIKNDIASGVSRTQLYLSKLILSVGMCVVLIFFYVLIAFLGGTIFQGGVGDLTQSNILSILKTLGAQGVILFAFTAIGVFLSFVVRRSAAVSGGYIAFSIVPVLLIVILSESNTRLLEYLKYDLTGCMKLFAYIDSVSSADILRGVITGAAYIFVTTLAGIMIFRRSEIK